MVERESMRTRRDEFVEEGRKESVAIYWHAGCIQGRLLQG